MKVLRWLLALAVGAYGLASLAPALAMLLARLGLSSVAMRLAPFTNWWQAAAGLGVAALLVLTALRLGRGRTVFGVALLAFAADAAVWWIVHASLAYQLAFRPAEVVADYYSLVGMMALLIAIWFLERSRQDTAAV